METILSILGILVSVAGCYISWKAYRYSKQANLDTTQLLKENLRRNADSDKEGTRKGLIEIALSEWQSKGEAKTFLRSEYKRLSSSFSKDEFEEIYETVSLRRPRGHVRGKLFD